ncbi:MAG TPA: hypothetical protein VH593_23990 [Ktedonobacteraceae bacterium]
MANVLKILRSIVPGNRPSSKTYGEPYVNFGDNQLGVFDSSNTARDLIGVPVFTTARSYPVNFVVSYQGLVYVSLVAVAAGAWNPAQWSPLASQSQVNAIAAFTTGDVKMTLKTVADAGWIMMNDQGIGDVGSSAAYANALAQNLFTLLWTNIPNSYCPVTPGGRGATAAADWAAKKQLTLPKVLGRALAVAGTGPGLTNRALGLILGEENHTLTIGELAVHHHDSNPHQHSWPNASIISLIGNQAVPYHTVDPGGSFNVPDYGGYVDPNAIPTSALGISTLDNGGGATHNNMQPSSFLNVMIKL